MLKARRNRFTNTGSGWWQWLADLEPLVVELVEYQWKHPKEMRLCSRALTDDD